MTNVVPSVRDPDGAVRSSEEAVRPAEQAGPEAYDQPACRVELVDRRDVGAVAALATAAVEDPDAGAIAIDINADRHSPYPSLRQLRPVANDAIRIGSAIRIVGLNLYGCRNRRRNGNPEKTDLHHDSRAFAHLDSSGLPRDLLATCGA